MQPIQINVQVNIGLNSELYTLLSSVVNRSAQVEEQPTSPKNKKTENPQPEPKLETTNQPPQTDGPSTAVDTQDPTPSPQEPAKEYTEVDVRAAMDRTRKRIEGENYKEKTDSEGYKKWHRALTGWFKNTAAMLGAEKPSALPDSESRGKFIACCDAVNVKGDELVQDCPF